MPSSEGVVVGDGRAPGAGRAALADSSFLVAMVLLSMLPYVSDLGFYSDDWPLVASWVTSGDQSLPGLVDAGSSADKAVRPLNVPVLSAIYIVSGPRPIAFHLATVFVFMAMGVTLYMTLRELGVSPTIALAVPLVYVLLPHYSAVRFWVVAMPMALSVALFLLSVYAELRALRAAAWRFWPWLALWAATLTASLLAYELVIPLALVVPGIVWWHGRARNRAVELRPGGSTRRVILVVGTAGLIGALLLFKFSTTDRFHPQPLAEHLRWMSWFLKGAVKVCFLDFGLRLPRLVAEILSRDAQARVIGLGALTGLAVFAWLQWRSPRTAEPAPRAMAASLFAGLALFPLGYGTLLSSGGPISSAAGANSRIAIVAALGIAFIWVGAIGLTTALLPGSRARRVSFSALIALACAIGVLIDDTLATFWVAANREQRRIVAQVRERFPARPPGDAFIVDGICPYSGPAVVFESSWDLYGALLATYGDPSLLADVVTPNLHVREDGLHTSLYYGFVQSHYPYGRLYIHHVGRNETVQLRGVEDARRYFADESRAGTTACPKGEEGHGVSVFGMWP